VYHTYTFERIVVREVSRDQIESWERQFLREMNDGEKENGKKIFKKISVFEKSCCFKKFYHDKHNRREWIDIAEGITNTAYDNEMHRSTESWSNCFPVESFQTFFGFIVWPLHGSQQKIHFPICYYPEQ
jgi:hypothetical protein